MDCHLVAVEVGVECGTDERVDLYRFTFDKHRLEGLNAKSVQRRSAIEKYRVLADHIFEDVPHDRFLLLDHLFRLLDRRSVSLLLKLVIDKRLEQLKSHLLRQSALMQMELRPDYDNRTARV